VREQRVKPELWFPLSRGAAEPAIRWCMACPVRSPCLLYAVSHKVYGVWGGKYLGPDAIRKRRHLE
jgi:hypothetical protein